MGSGYCLTSDSWGVELSQRVWRMEVPSGVQGRNPVGVWGEATRI